MPWAGVNRIAVETPDEADRIVDAFRRRSGKVDLHPGFQKFELWREESGKEVMVITRWDTREHFVAWTESEAFRAAHRHAEGAPGTGGGSVYEILLTA